MKAQFFPCRLHQSRESVIMLATALRVGFFFQDRDSFFRNVPH